MNCPVCFNPGTARQPFVGSDFLFATTPRTFGFSACTRCQSLFIDPAPMAEELASFYPSRYWWNSSTDRLSRLESIYRRIALRDHLAFVIEASKTLADDREPVRLL